MLTYLDDEEIEDKIKNIKLFDYKINKKFVNKFKINI